MVTTFAVLVGLMAGGAGKIQVDVTPGNAVIELDGKRLDSRVVSAQAGDHTLRVSSSGYATKTQKVRVVANRTSKVTIRLKAVAKKAPAKSVVIGRKTINKRPSKRPVPVVKRPIKNDPTPTPVRRPVVRKTTVKTTVKTVKTDPRPNNGVRKKTVKTNTVVNRRPARKTVGVRPAPARGGVSGRRGGGRGSQSLRPWAVLSFVVGGAALTGGYIVNGMAQDKADEFNTSRNRTEKLSLHKDAKDLDTASTVLYGVGATGVALGVLLLAMDPGDRRATVAPLPGGGAMVGYTGSF